MCVHIYENICSMYISNITLKNVRESAQTPEIRAIELSPKHFQRQQQQHQQRRE